MSVYNSSTFLEETMQSVLSQTYKDFEFLIVNDASTDNSQDILSKVHDPRIRIITNPNNMGLARSLNIGIRASQGIYIARIDGDDIMAPTRLEKQVRFLDEHHDICLVGSSSMFMDMVSGITRPYRLPTDHVTIFYHFLTGRNALGHPFVMYRKEAVVEAGLYNEALTCASDYELWLKMVRKGFKFRNLPEPLTMYRTHNQQMTYHSNTIQIQNHYNAFFSFTTSVLTPPAKKSETDAYLNLLIQKMTRPTLEKLKPAYVIFKSLLSILDDKHMRAQIYFLFFKEYIRPCILHSRPVDAFRAIRNEFKDAFSFWRRLGLLRKYISRWLRDKNN